MLKSILNLAFEMLMLKDMTHAPLLTSTTIIAYQKTVFNPCITCILDN